MPHTIAEQAVAATHELARLTRPAITTLDAAEIARLTQTLTKLAAGLSQTLTQLSNYNAAANAHANLQHAATAAGCLATALNTAHHDLGDTAETPDSEPEGVNFQPAKRGQTSTGVDTRHPSCWR
jgi:hypothetical protein